MATPDQISELLSRGVVNILPNKKSLHDKLLASNPLNIYLGIDPTATRIHIGHAVTLRKLQHFADLGHNVTFLIGDFTALIGDTSDKNEERPILTSEQIEENFQTYKKQAEKIINFNNVSVRHNSEWLSKLTFKDVVELLQHFSIGDFVSRELIRDRLRSGKRVGLHEAIYPVMQGYDSYFMDTDIQIGGADQTFNMQAGRTLQKDYRNKESYVLVTGYLEGTDGRKMSKSWGNAIWLEDEPNEMFGKIMSLRDELISNYLVLATSLTIEQTSEMSARAVEEPMQVKKELAYLITRELHTEDDAEEAQRYFEDTFQKGQDYSLVPEVTFSGEPTIIALMVDNNYAGSNSEAKRLLSENAVELDKQPINDPTYTLSEDDSGKVLRVGKKNIVRLNHQ